MLTRVAILALILVLTLTEGIDAQTGKSTSGQNTPVETPRQPEADPLERDTPRSAIVAFLRAIQRENYERAAQYLDSRLKLRERQELARQLAVVLDRKLSISLNALSDKPEGDIDDGQRTNRDKVGLIHGKPGDVEILLDRVQRGRDRPLWLFSSESLQEVPGLYREIEPVWLEQFVPDRLRTRRWFHVPLYQWIAGLLSLPLILVIAAILSRALIVLLRPLARRLTQEQDVSRLAKHAWPLRLQVLACVIYAASRYSVSLLARRFWTSVAITLTVIALVWLFMRLGDVITGLLSRRLLRLNRSVDVMLVRLTNRLGKVALVTVGGLFLLHLAGVNLTAVLTGLGLGGVAIAFAAQKTLENLFGGIMIISDKPVQVGDFCKAGEFLGVVEDIGLRSTRLRTVDRTIVAIPNGQLATMSLENFTLRDRIRFRHLIGLRYETAADELRYILDGIDRLLREHSRVDSQDARVRFVGFGSSSLDVEILAYILTTDFTVFLAIQQELLLRIMDIIEASGTAIALPSQTTYVVGESELKPVRGREGIQKIQNGREHKKLRSSGPPIENLAAFSGTSEYPPAGSPTQEKNEK